MTSLSTIVGLLQLSPTTLEVNLFFCENGKTLQLFDTIKTRDTYASKNHCKPEICKNSLSKVVESVDEHERNIIQFDRKMQGFHESDCNPNGHHLYSQLAIVEVRLLKKYKLRLIRAQN